MLWKNVVFSLDSVGYDELKSYWKDKSRPLPVMLVGNKTDLITNPTVLRRLAEKKEKVVTMKEV